MKKIALAAAAVLALTGAALAENDNFGNTDINVIARQQRQQQVDTMRTSSVNQAGYAYKLPDPKTDSSAQGSYGPNGTIVNQGGVFDH